MNAYQQIQRPGIRWPEVPAALLYPQGATTRNVAEPRRTAVDLEDFKRQMAEYEAEFATSMKDVQKHFVLPSDSSVKDFLRGHRTVLEMLLESVVPLGRCFAAGTIFGLRSPIDESGSQTLYVVAMWPQPVQQARDALDKFDSTWWLSNAMRAAGLLAFTYELV